MRRLPNVSPPSGTVNQHWNGIGAISGVFCVDDGM